MQDFSDFLIISCIFPSVARRVFPHKFFFFFISFAARKVAKFHSKSIDLVMTPRRIPSSVLTSSPRSPHSRNLGKGGQDIFTIIPSPVVLGLGEGSTLHLGCYMMLKLILFLTIFSQYKINLKPKA